MAQDSRNGAPGHHSLRSLNRAPTKGKSKSKAPKVSGRSPRRGERAAKGSPWIITFTTNALDHAADPTTARSGMMGGCVMPPQRRSGLPGLPAEGRQSWGGQDGCRWEGTSPGCYRPRKPLHRRKGVDPARALQKFAPHPPRQWEEPPERPRAGDPPGKGRSKGGQNRQGKQQAQGQTTSGSDKAHTETPGGTSPTFPWMQDTPERLRSRLRWTPRPVPESSKPTLILLYAGKDDAGALDAYLHAYNPAFSEYIWAVDIRRKGGDLGQDMLGDELCSMAMAGKVVGGGPNCRTWSILRWFPKPGGPPPARGRAEQTLVGLGGPGASGKGGHGQRQRAHAPTDVPDFLEHPMDPMECSKSPSAARCSSIWVTRAYIQWANALHHSLIKFDECRLGQVVVKSTTLPTDLPLHHWHDLRCNHGAHFRGEKLNSSHLSRHPEQMMQGLAAAILCRAGPVLEALRPGGTVP